MSLPRLTFFALFAATTAGLIALFAGVLSPGGWTPVKVALLLCFLPAAPWLGICVGNALPGFLILVLARNPARAVLPVDGNIESGAIALRTAIAVTIRNEDMEAVLPPLARLLDELADPTHFTLFLLSDTQDPKIAAAEQAAIAGFPHPLRYRRRAENTGFKAGNVMEFLDHHVDGHDLVLMLDADSAMSADAVRRLARIMQADPTMGLVQHLTAGLPATAAFPRLFQFGMRHGMRVWSVGQAFWQRRDGPYWGHNAIFRAEPFRAHCRLTPLPGGAPILSHDQVEAAQLAAAGWGVAVWADDRGSYEANPPAMPEFLHRDGRWLAGNLQYHHLLRRPGFTAMGRWQLVQAMLLFAGAPLYVVMFALAVVAAVQAPEAAPRGPIGWLAAAWALALYSPKLLGYADTLLFSSRRAEYGGAGRFAVGAVAEILFTLLLDAPSYISKLIAMTRLALGAKPAWLPQNRAERGVTWGEATRLYWLHTLVGVSCFTPLAWASPAMALLALPFAGGLLVVIPFCVLTSSPTVSAWLRARGIAAMPEELG